MSGTRVLEQFWNSARTVMSSRTNFGWGGIVSKGKNPVCTGRLFHCYMLDKSICHFRGVRSILLPLFYLLWKNPVSKHCRPWSDATLCGIRSGSALFACDPFMGFQVWMELKKMSLHVSLPGRVAQSVGHLTRKSGALGSIPSLATYFRFSFRFFKKGSCQLLAKVCARSTG